MPTRAKLGRRDLLRRGDSRHRVILVGAQHDADRRRLVGRLFGVVEEVDVHLHLAKVLVRELAELQIDQHEAAQEPAVGHQIDEEVIALERDAFLPGAEAEALAELEQKRLESIDDRLLEVALAPSRPLV